MIIVVGGPYSGKSYFIENYMEKPVDYEIIHVGDLVRKKGIMTASVDYSVILDIFKEMNISDKKYIIDNPFKTYESMIKFFEIYNNQIEMIYFIEDKRTNIDYSTRNRKDDNFIPLKIENWNKNKEKIKHYLLRLFNCKIVTNTNNGFTY